MAMPSNPTYDITQNCPDGLEYIKLPGHYFDMIGIRTSDDIIFLADSIFGENTINKYHFFFIYDVKGYLETLDTVSYTHLDVYKRQSMDYRSFPGFRFNR